MNVTLLALLWVLYLFLFVRHVTRQQLGIRLGIVLGTMHLLLLPMTVLLFEGEFYAPSGSSIPAVSWEGNAFTITKILLMIGAYGLFEFARQLTPPQAPQAAVAPNPLYEAIAVLRPVHLWAIYLVAAISVFFISGLATGDAHWARTKGDFMSDQGTLGLLFLIGSAAIRVAMLIALAAAYLAGRMRLQVFALLLAVACIVDLYTTGTRLFTLQSLAVVGISIILTKRYYVLAMMGIAAVPLALAMTIFPAIRAFMHQWQGSGIGAAWAAFVRAFDKATDYYSGSLGIGGLLRGVTESVNINALVAVVEGFHASYGMLWGQTIARSFLFWIPRSIWPQKPPNITLIIGQYLVPGGETSMGATLFGEFYINFGVWGVLAIPIVLFVIERTLRWMLQDPVISAVAAFTLGFTLVRMPVGDSCVQFLVVVAILKLTRLGPMPHAPVTIPDAAYAR